MARIKMKKRKRRRRKPTIITNIKLESDNNNNNLIEKPFKFFRIIFPAINQHSLSIPDKFSEKFAPELSNVATLAIPTGLSWKITLSRIKNKLYLTQGWVDFMEDNDIKCGYFLEFEYYGNNHFEVYIFDLTCCQIVYPTEYNCYIVDPKKIQKEKRVEMKEEVDEYDDDNDDDDEMKVTHGEDGIQKSRCKYPSFTLEVIQSAIHYGHIPSSFAKEHMNRTVKSAKLQVGKVSVWHVGCYWYKGTGVRMRVGWKKFVEDNHWSRGESYTFVLVAKKRTSVVFNVIKA